MASVSKPYRERCEEGPFPFSEPVSGGGRPSAAAEQVLAAVESVSRRLEDLARELNCLGFFDGDDDRPRAA